MFTFFLCVTAHPKGHPISFLLWQGAAPKSIPAHQNWSPPSFPTVLQGRDQRGLEERTTNTSPLDGMSYGVSFSGVT